MSQSIGPQEENCNRGDDFPWKHVLLKEGRFHGRRFAYPGSVIRIGDPLYTELVKAGLGQAHDGPEAFADAPAEDAAAPPPPRKADVAPPNPAPAPAAAATPAPAAAPKPAK